LSQKRTNPLKKNEIIDLKIESITNEGSGVGHFGGVAVFVPMSAPGDTLRVRIVKVLSSYCYGIIEKIVSPSCVRTEPGCPVYRSCGGCSLRHIDYSAELAEKHRWVSDALSRIGGFDITPLPILPSPCESRYRNKAQYPFAFIDGRTVCGFYSPRSHRVIPISDCMLQPQVFSDICAAVCSYIDSIGAAVYDEETQSGLFRHLYIRRGERSGEIMVCLVVNGSSIPHPEKLLDLLLRVDSNIVSVMLCENTRFTNVVLGDKFTVLYGKDNISDTLCGVDMALSPQSFYQVNSKAAEQLYSVVKEFASLKKSDTLLDLYCGIGSIGLSMAESAGSLIGIECVGSAVADARKNASANGIRNCRFICADAGSGTSELLANGERPDVIILDPPRKGCSPDTLDAVLKLSPERIVMVSCEPSSMARDLRILADGGYTLLAARPVDMFPRTRHVETVVLLSKGEVDSKKIRVEFSLEDMDMSEFQDGATYPQIKAYVLEHSGLKVSNLYISQIKRKCGIEVGKNYNLPKSEDSRQPQCPPEKEKAIREAFKYFGMI